MTEPTAAIEAQIARLLALHGTVSPDSLAGLSHSEGAAHLARYAADHAAEGLRLEGGVLMAAPAPEPVTPVAPAAPAPPAGPAAGPPGAGDEAPAAGLDPNMRFWMWVLTIAIAPIGGIIAWAMAKDRDPLLARKFALVTAAVTILPCAIGAIVATFLPTTVQPASVGWPASSSGRPVYYYFGTAG